MPALSKKQQMAAGAALAAKRGEIPAGRLKGASKGMFKSMTASQLREFAGTRRKGLPVRKKVRGSGVFNQSDMRQGFKNIKI